MNPLPLPPSPTPPSPVRVYFLAPLQAGAIAASGSVLGLIVAIAIDSAPGHTVPTAVWVAFTAASCTLAVFFGYRDKLAPASFAGRVLGAAVFGFLLASIPITIVTERFARPKHDAEALWALAVAFLMLLVVGLWGRFSRSLEERLEKAVSEGSQAPVEAPATLGDHEAESDDPAVEVRVLWGADLLWVTHLSPPRSFHAVDCPIPFDATMPIVIADGERAVAIAPAGATGMIVQRDRRTRLDHAIDAGLAEPDASTPEARRIPLDLGTRVTLSLPVHGPRTAYRAAHEGREVADTPLVIEIAMVRAGRDFGRARSFGGAARVAFAAVFALALVSGVRAWDTANTPLCTEDCDQPSDDVMRFLSLGMAAVDEREEARVKADEEEAARDPDATRMRWHWEMHELKPRREWHSRWDELHRVGESFALDRPFEMPNEMTLFGPWVYCGGAGGSPDEPKLSEFPSIHDMFCESPQFSPFGMRMLGPPPSIDVLGRDPTDFWSHRFALALREAPAPTRAAHLRMKILRATGLDSITFERVLNTRRGALRDCPRLVDLAEPGIDPVIEIDFVIGVDGTITLVRHVRVAAHGPRRKPALCLAQAMIGARIEPPPAKVGSVLVRFEMR